MNHNSEQKRGRAARLALIALAAGLIVAAGIYVLTLDSDDAADPGAANPDATAIDYERALAGAPPQLAALYAQGDALIEGGPEEFEAQLAGLEGHPVVVNKWASWCGPCRFEFPHFQQAAAKLGDRIAFLGVNANDSTDAAETFLEDYPLPYPSVSDPADDVGELFEGYAFPSTAFYDAEGELVYTRQGPYESLRDLTDEIEKFLG